MEVFHPQDIANILHIIVKSLAKKRYKTCILTELVRRAEEISEKFNSQDIENTLWAYTTMGTKPGSGRDNLRVIEFGTLSP
jgi:hypothetical protein